MRREENTNRHRDERRAKGNEEFPVPVCDCERERKMRGEARRERAAERKEVRRNEIG